MAPLYSVYVIPRYILMTVLANYVLIPLALASLYRMAVRRLRPPVGVTSSGLNI
jgi:hypothetical protein